MIISRVTEPRNNDLSDEIFRATTCVLVADVDSDSDTDSNDLTAIADGWGERHTDAGWGAVEHLDLDHDGESSGIADASEWFGDGAWLLDVQAHGTWREQEQEEPGATIFELEDGQLLLMIIPGS